MKNKSDNVLKRPVHFVKILFYVLSYWNWLHIVQITKFSCWSFLNCLPNVSKLDKHSNKIKPFHSFVKENDGSLFQVQNGSEKSRKLVAVKLTDPRIDRPMSDKITEWRTNRPMSVEITEWRIGRQTSVKITDRRIDLQVHRHLPPQRQVRGSRRKHPRNESGNERRTWRDGLLHLRQGGRRWEFFVSKFLG